MYCASVRTWCACPNTNASASAVGVVVNEVDLTRAAGKCLWGVWLGITLRVV